MQRNWNSRMLLVGDAKGTASLESSWAVSNKAKLYVTILPSNPLPWVLIQVKRKHNNLYAHVYSGVISNYQKLETIQVSLGQGWINCGTYVQWTTTQKLKGNKLWIHTTAWMNLRCTRQSKKSQTPKAI